jgi:hypothetical protein
VRKQCKEDMGEVYSLHVEGNAYEIVISNGFAALEILNDG